MQNFRQAVKPHLAKGAIILLFCIFASSSVSSLSYGQIEKFDLKKSLGELITPTESKREQGVALEKPIDPKKYV